ncbi:MAG: methylmalonyl-CoA mutase, N-terminal domain [Gaiellales bacterium]|jgi:methylmalonyl-CoA mutase N-terminal domain/subunit|nr:methylmalonyl-CoA mutase, N-terminal domain [Gaiellales bacterium]
MAASDQRRNDSGIPIAPYYTIADGSTKPDPGSYPYTRGVHADGYRRRPWTMRQYAGFSSAEETNRRFHLLLDRGQTGLSVAFDLPTQLGLDSDHPLSLGEVGRTGVAIDSIEDMRLLLDGIPLGEVSTSMTINAPGSLLLLLYELVAEEQGVSPQQLSGTTQNDILKEYIARGNYIFPARPSMRLTVDTFRYCTERLPRWNTISISGYHIREAGSTAAQELAFTLANGIAYVQAAVDAGLEVDTFAGRLSFFFNAHNDFFQEVAKFRAARMIWAEVMRDRFGAADERSLMLRYHAQTGGSTLTAQQPENNIVRVAIQAFAAVCGGGQSLHTNGFDEAQALPTERSATIALRTQQILATEAGASATADPLGGSYYIEALTDELAARARALIAEIDEMGGAVAAVEAGWVQDQIEQAAFEHHRRVQSGDEVIVGVNRWMEEDEQPIQLHTIDPDAERRQVERTQALRAAREGAAVESALAAVASAAAGADNLLPPMREALRAEATIGEVCQVLREQWGTYDGQRPRA